MSEYRWLDIFADNLARMLVEHRMTQRELAELSGLAESTISRFLTKQTVPSIRAVINMSYALHCSTDDLIDFGEMVH